jgi:thiamine biosynthesis protein ThiS
MTIFINGEARELDDGLTVASMLEALRLPKQRVAIELNRRVVRKQEWESTAVSDNDRIEVVHFVGGG